MSMRNIARTLAVLGLLQILGGQVAGFSQFGLPDMEDGRRAKIRDTDTNTYDCLGRCSGSVGCC